MSQEKDRLEIELHTNPSNIQAACSLTEIYLAENRLEKAGKLVDSALKELNKHAPTSIRPGINLVDVALKLWKGDRFASRGSVRLNCSLSRQRVLESIKGLIEVLMKIHDRDTYQSLCLKAAYVNESLGSYQETLTLLSDLITMQATEGVDLSYIIFKAAIVLRHVGHIKQAIEYLEFLADDPPTEGLNRLHVAAFVVTVYELSGEKYKVFLAKAYRDLVTTIVEEADPQRNGAAAKQYKRLESMTRNLTTFQTNPDFWEVMSLQAIERCEYVLASAFLHLAIQKSNNKGPLQHYLAEVLWLLGEKEPAEKAAERAFAVLPQNPELRNLLLAIAPDKWTEKVRFLSPTKTDSIPVSNIGDNAIAKESAVDASSQNNAVNNTNNRPSSSSSSSSSSTGLVGRLRSTAATAFQVFQQASFRSNNSSSNLTSGEINNYNNYNNSSSNILNNARPVSPSRTTNTNPRPEPIQETNADTVLISGKTNEKKSKYDVRPNALPVHAARRVYVGKPLKPPPVIDPEEKKTLGMIQQGNTNIHLYQPELVIYANIQRRIARDKALEEQRAKILEAK